jgi:hypothetical protein
MATAVPNDNNMAAVTVVPENVGNVRTHLRLDTRLNPLSKVQQRDKYHTLDDSISI